MSEENQIEQATYQPIKKMSFTFLLSTLLGIGKIPFAPGTFGSLVAVIDFVIFVGFFQSPNPFWPIMFFIGWYTTYNYCLITKKHDPKEVVIDEYVGQYASISITYYFAIFFAPELFDAGPNTLLMILAANFALFRYFDISKVSLVGYFDRQDNAFSIMMDDLVAGIFAAAITIMIIVVT